MPVEHKCNTPSGWFLHIPTVYNDSAIQQRVDGWQVISCNCNINRAYSGRTEPLPCWSESFKYPRMNRHIRTVKTVLEREEVDYCICQLFSIHSGLTNLTTQMDA